METKSTKKTTKCSNRPKSPFLYCRMIFWLLYLGCYLALEPSCDPILHFGALEARDCLYPLPNDYYLIDQPSTFTGKQVYYPMDKFPSPVLFKRMNLSRWEERDGWSASGPIVLSNLPENWQVRFAEIQNYEKNFDLDGYREIFNSSSGFPSHLWIQRSLQKDSPSLLIDAETGERVAHWMELDMPILFNNKKKQTWIMQPAQRLKNKHRYIVAFKNILNEQGRPVQPPEGFKRIRDGYGLSSPELYQRYQHYREKKIFKILLENGHIQSLNQLYLCWDFTTSSLISTTEHLRSMRDDAYLRSERDLDFEYHIDSVHYHYSKLIYKKIEGSFTAPLYLSNENPSAETHLVRNLSAPTYLQRLRPRFQKYIQVPFTVWVPYSAIRGGYGKTSIMVYGHGIFGNRYEADLEFFHEDANRDNHVIVATDLIGLQRKDLMPIAEILIKDLTLFSSIPDRCSQGILNQLLLIRLLKESKMVTDERVFGENGKSILATETINGKLKPKYLVYEGNSFGAIMGTIITALSPDLKIANLGVPGGPFSILFPRNSFGNLIFNVVIPFHYPRPSDRILLLFLIHQIWEYCDPAGFLDPLRTGQFLDQPGQFSNLPDQMGTKKLLLHVAVGDCEVNNIAGFFILRSLNAFVYPNDAYELQFKNDDSQVQLNPRIFEPTADFHYKQHPVSLLNVLYSRNTSNVHSVATVFQYKNTPYFVPFHARSPSRSDCSKYDHHESPRRTLEATRQRDLFMKVYKEQKDSGQFDDDFVWVESVCENGCWDMEKPSTIDQHSK